MGSLVSACPRQLYNAREFIHVPKLVVEKVSLPDCVSGPTSPEVSSARHPLAGLRLGIGYEYARRLDRVSPRAPWANPDSSRHRFPPRSKLRGLRWGRRKLVHPSSPPR